MNTPFILRTSAAVLLSATAFAGPTTATFETTSTTDTPATLTQSGPAPGPMVLPDGPSGNFLRLINDTVNGQVNHYSFDVTQFGADWSSITAEYDFRLGGTGGNADGISFLLIPTSPPFGASGVGPTNFVAEEPNIAGVFGIGHDVYLDNAVSVHWDGAEHVNVSPNTTNTINFADSLFHHAKIEMVQVGNSMNVVVNVTRDVYGQTPQIFQLAKQSIHMQPFENRVQFSGRTGGLDMNADIDNVNVVYSGTAATLPTTTVTGKAYQDFDSANTTRFVTNSTSGSKNNPNFEGPLVQATGGSDGGAFLQLAKDSQGDTLTAVALDRGADSGLASARRVEVDFRMANPDGQAPADGLGIFLLPTADFDRHGNGPSIAYENPGVANTLAIGLPLYNNAVPGLNRVTLKWNNTEIGLNDVPTSSIDFLNNLWNRAQIDVTPADGGANVTVRMIPDVNNAASEPFTIFDKTFVPGLSAYDFRIMAGARTGGATATVDVDRLTSTTLATGSPTTNTLQNFDVVGTGYRAFDSNGSGKLHPAIVAGGVSGNALRLSHADNGQMASIGFEKSIPDGVKTRVTAEFDFKMSSDNVAQGIHRADGFQMALLDVNRYGNEGPIDEAGHAYEQDLLGGALSLGFRIYDGNINTLGDFIRLGYDGQEANFTPFNTDTFNTSWFDLNSDAFHHAKLELASVDGLTLATLTLTPGMTGTPVVIFSDVTVPNLDLASFEFRQAFGARTGGLNTIVDIDNVSLAAVPEPSTLLALLAGGALLGLRRRRVAR